MNDDLGRTNLVHSTGGDTNNVREFLCFFRTHLGNNEILANAQFKRLWNGIVDLKHVQSVPSGVCDSNGHMNKLPGKGFLTINTSYDANGSCVCGFSKPRQPDHNCE